MMYLILGLVMFIGGCVGLWLLEFSDSAAPTATPTISARSRLKRVMLYVVKGVGSAICLIILVLGAAIAFFAYQSF